MSILDDGAPKLIQGNNASEIAERLSHDLLEAVKANDIAMEVDGAKITLRSRVRRMLEITSEGVNAFRLREDLDNQLNQILTPVTTPARPHLGGGPFTQDEMTIRIKTWLREQR